MGRRTEREVEAEFQQSRRLLGTLPSTPFVEDIRAAQAAMPPLGDSITHLGYQRDEAGDRVRRPTTIDRDTLAGADLVFTEDQAVAEALRVNHGIRVASPRRIVRYIERLLTTNPLQLGAHRLIVGFAGFAGRGYQYGRVEDGANTLLTGFAGQLTPGNLTRESPAAVVTGGTNMGVPLVGSMYARYRRIPSIGIVPRQGLHLLAPNDTVIIRGSEFGQETDLIGLIPDVLVVAGGGANSTKEYLQALDAGSTVIMMILDRDEYYPDGSLVRTYTSFPQTELADSEGRLLVCRNTSDIQDALATVLANKKQIIRRRAARRIKVIQTLLSAPAGQ